MKTNTAIINAGGQNLRMGFDKAFIDVDGKSLIEWVIDSCRQEFEEIIIVTNSKEKYLGFENVKVVEDIFKDVGPIGGLHSGLLASSSQYSFFIACDMPYLNIPFIKYLKSSLQGFDAAIADTKEGIEPFHGFYSKTLVRIIEENIMQYKLSFYKLLKSVNTNFIDEQIVRKYSNNLELFTNLNTPEELEAFYKRNKIYRGL